MHPLKRVATNAPPFGLFASRRYSRCARRLRRGGRSAGSRCSLMSQPVLLRHALAAIIFASRRYSRFARRLRRGGRSAGSRCSLMSQPVLLRHALAAIIFASRRYSRFARRLRRGGLSAGSRCSLMSQSVLLRHAPSGVRAAGAFCIKPNRLDVCGRREVACTAAELRLLCNI